MFGNPKHPTGISKPPMDFRRNSHSPYDRVIFEGVFYFKSVSPTLPGQYRGGDTDERSVRVAGVSAVGTPSNFRKYTTRVNGAFS